MISFMEGRDSGTSGRPVQLDYAAPSTRSPRRGLPLAIAIPGILVVCAIQLAVLTFGGEYILHAGETGFQIGSFVTTGILLTGGCFSLVWLGLARLADAPGPKGCAGVAGAVALLVGALVSAFLCFCIVCMFPTT
jgi:hypothetical protein